MRVSITDQGVVRGYFSKIEIEISDLIKTDTIENKLSEFEKNCLNLGMRLPLSHGDLKSLIQLLHSLNESKSSRITLWVTGGQ